MDKKTILVVEDEDELLELIVRKLEMSDFLVLKAKTVPEALDILIKNEIALVWLDHYLSENKNGLDLVFEMKKTPIFKDIPVFVVSNTADQEEVKSYISIGVNKYYVKTDANINEIIEDIKNHFKSSGTA